MLCAYTNKGVGYLVRFMVLSSWPSRILQGRYSPLSHDSLVLDNYPSLVTP
jgi:hypothetical protein